MLKEFWDCDCYLMSAQVNNYIQLNEALNLLEVATLNLVGKYSILVCHMNVESKLSFCFRVGYISVWFVNNISTLCLELKLE